MRRLLLAAVVACAVVWSANADVNTMPGQVVGNGFTLSKVGSQAAPSAGSPVGSQVGRPLNVPADSPNMRRYDPARPYDVFKGTNLSADQLVAPLPGVGGDMTVLEKLYAKLKSIVGLGPPQVAAGTLQTNSTYFPSLTRRNRERAQARLWRRD